jgi:Kef-type K+ transport system membrane component KefB
MSLLLFSLAIAGAEAILTGAQSLSLLQIIEYPIFEIGGSIVLGLATGLLLNAIMQRMKSYHDSMAISVGFVFLSVGLSQTLGLSLILTSMVMGITVVNRSPQHGKRIRFTIEQAGPVIYVLFFTLVGARFQLSLIPTMGMLGIAYVLLRTFGKFAGAWVGGAIGGAEPAVRDNLGLGLLSQAGVAIGLALNCECRFAELGPEGQALGSLVLSVITATTFIVQIIGPIGVKLAIKRADEIGKARFSNGWVADPADNSRG